MKALMLGFPFPDASGHSEASHATYPILARQLAIAPQVTRGKSASTSLNR